jgi:HAD superfamily hydrolase (TIGR01509 family)
MTIAAVIFDVDGTLVDSNGLHARAWERAFASLGLSVPFGRVLPFIGEAGDKLVADLVSVDAATAKRLGEREPQEFERLARHDGISPYAGSEELLRELKRRGTRTAVATSSGRSGFQVVRETTDLPSLDTMDVVVTNDDVKNAKPAPDLVSTAADKLGIARDRCLLVGDTPYDGEAATRAGVLFIALATGIHSEAALRAAGASQVHAGPAALLEQLDEVLRGSPRER